MKQSCLAQKKNLLTRFTVGKLKIKKDNPDASPIQLKSKDIPGLREKILWDYQDGICPICEKAVKDPCLDHHHVKRIGGTGLIRGVLCRTCNSFIAKAENNCVRFNISRQELPDILRATADYLEAEQYPYLHPSEAPKPKKLMKSSYNKLKKAYKGLPVRSPFPNFPKSGKLIKPLENLYKFYDIEPEFYK